jgi:hypothetical protein
LSKHMRVCLLPAADVDASDCLGVA